MTIALPLEDLRDPRRHLAKRDYIWRESRRRMMCRISRVGWWKSTHLRTVALCPPAGCALLWMDDAYVHRMTAGPDGNLWFTDHNTNQVGRVTTSGSITQLSLPTPADPRWRSMAIRRTRRLATSMSRCSGRWLVVDNRAGGVADCLETGAIRTLFDRECAGRRPGFGVTAVGDLNGALPRAPTPQHESPGVTGCPPTVLA